MMSDITEIRWHGRGGQGAKTAALLFATLALGEGKYVQGFPEYGPERMGAPVRAFNRLSEKPIRLHSGVTNPDFVVVLDPTLIEKAGVTLGLPKEGKILINTSLSPKDIKAKIKFDGKVATVNASKISRETIGRDIPNTPMLAALVKVTGLIKFERMLKDIDAELKKKFASKPEVVEGNIKAIKRAYEEVKED